VIAGLAALLGGNNVSWRALEATPAEVLHVCAEEDVGGLLHERLCTLVGITDWPEHVRGELARVARENAARELLRRREIVSVLDALASKHVHALLFKGTPLAYSVYSAPHLRPRSDTDLLISRDESPTVHQVLAELGYAAPVYCNGELLFRQFELQKTDDFGVTHAFDFHWKVSTQSVFAEVLTYNELAIDAVPVRALGSNARAAGPLHALLLACIHPVMHHRNVERLIWIYDIHLLASRFTAAEFDRFASLAVTKHVSTVCAHQLALARARFGTPIPSHLTARLNAARGDEPTAEYLRPKRRWHDELRSSVLGLARWTDRARLLREVLFPAPSYMVRAYGLKPGPLGTLLLPALYLHRGVRGGINVFVGRK
jgi:hypothetical protein